MLQISVPKPLLNNCVNWFSTEFYQKVEFIIQSQFPNYPLPGEVQLIRNQITQLTKLSEASTGPNVEVGDIVENRLGGLPCGGLLKQMILLYRRYRAEYVEGLLGKTFHLRFTALLKEEIDTLDAIVAQSWFQGLTSIRLPHAIDFLSIQYVDKSTADSQASGTPTMRLLDRQFDEKFHILQAPTLFLPDLAYFRNKCDMRDTSLAVAFLDIDDFKRFNSKHSETKIDLNLLPHFMHALEAQVFHHGYAYRQGGDEYLLLLPSLSRALAIAFLDELRCKLSSLNYQEIDENTTVSIGLCIAEPNCPLTDRELRMRANQAKTFAKNNGKNCIATYNSNRFIPEELSVVTGPRSRS